MINSSKHSFTVAVHCPGEAVPVMESRQLAQQVTEQVLQRLKDTHKGCWLTGLSFTIDRGVQGGEHGPGFLVAKVEMSVSTDSV